MLIDVVLFHVDGQAEGYSSLHNEHCGPLHPCQVRDLGELRYVLRSIESHAPWVSAVHLVVQDRRHVPSWIDPSQIHVVCHDEFIPESILPTFQVGTLQGHMHLIPGLSEYFIQWCDDYFLGEKVDASFFFDRDKNPRNLFFDSPVWPILGWFRKDLYMKFLLNTRTMVRGVLSRHIGLFRGACFLLPHVPVAVLKSDWAEMVGRFSGHTGFAKSTQQKTRGTQENSGDVIVDMTYIQWRNISKRKQISAAGHAICFGLQVRRLFAVFLKRIGFSNATLSYGIYKIKNDPKLTQKAMKRLLAQQPLFFCINDDAYDHYEAPDNSVYHAGMDISPESQRVMTQTLQTLYPQRSRFEADKPASMHHEQN